MHVLPGRVSPRLGLDREQQFPSSPERALHKGLVRNNPVHNPMHKEVLAPQRPASHFAQVNPRPRRVLPCPRVWAIVAQFRVQRPEASSDRVDRDLASRCGRKVPGELATVRTLRALAERVAPLGEGQAYLLVVREEHLAKGLVRCRPVRAPVRARLDGRQCCRRFQTKCRRRQSRASRSTLVSLRRGNGPLLTNAKLKASGSFIPHGNAPAQVDEVWPRLSRRRSHARREILP